MTEEVRKVIKVMPLEKTLWTLVHIAGRNVKRWRHCGKMFGGSSNN